VPVNRNIFPTSNNIPYNTFSNSQSEKKPEIRFPGSFKSHTANTNPGIQQNPEYYTERDANKNEEGGGALP